MDDFEKLVEYFKRFPGVGPRQARRMVYFLLRQSPEWVATTAALMKQLRSEIHICTSCFRQFVPKGAASLCAICSNPARDKSELMIVERDVDLENIERSRVYTGLFFVLGGTASLLDEKSHEYIRLSELQKTVQEKIADGSLQEIVLACATSPAGEETAHLVLEKLKDTLEGKNITLTTLGRGLSTGAELEYADKETLKNAFENRK